MPLRKSSFFLLFVVGSTLVLGMLFIHAVYQTRADLPRLQQQIKVVESLHLTDLCLSTEARHVRHLSQADWHSPFQSHPLSLDHFPSGALIQPPAMLTRPHDRLP
jgi:hypothetical protein